MVTAFATIELAVEAMKHGATDFVRKPMTPEILRNAVDAALETHGEVVIGWREKEDAVEIFVQDEGPGIMNPANLFVPFFTTKPDGSGIGLPLSRQIAEAHGGSLALLNRKDGKGAEALLRLPL